MGFLTAHLSSPPVPPRLRRPDLSISPALDQLISRALDAAARAPIPVSRGEAQRALRLPPEGRRGLEGPEEVSRGQALETGRPSRRPFWAFVAVMAAPIVCGGAMVVLVKRTSAY